ncbi:YceI family protein [Hydrogenimonas sp.]
MVAKMVVATMAAASILLAQECTWKVKDVEVEWEAFKTPAKIGVKGSFGNIKLSARPQKSRDALLKGAKVVIDTASVDSKNKGRDAKLVKFFFKTQGVDTITARVVDVQKERCDVNITMNGITRTVPFKLEREDDEVEAEGYIDLADFDMLPSLKSINKACYELHQGKTWQDVKLEFELKTAEICK